MFAIIKVGNQQFKVKAGDFIRAPFQKLSAGDKMDIPVLAFGTEKDMICDSSQLKKSKVKALLLRQSLANKVIVFKKKRRKGYRRTQGHRQKISELRILELCSPDGKVSKIDLGKKSPSYSKKAEEARAKKTTAKSKATAKKSSKSLKSTTKTASANLKTAIKTKAKQPAVAVQTKADSKSKALKAPKSITKTTSVVKVKMKETAQKPAETKAKKTAQKGD